MRKRAIVSPGSEQCPTYTHIYKIYRFVSNYWTHMKQTCILSCIFTRIRLWVVLNSNILVMLVCIKNMLTYSTTIYYHEPILSFIYDMISNWTLVHIILSWHDMESVYQYVYIYIRYNGYFWIRSLKGKYMWNNRKHILWHYYVVWCRVWNVWFWPSEINTC